MLCGKYFIQNIVVKIKDRTENIKNYNQRCKRKKMQQNEM